MAESLEDLVRTSDKRVVKEIDNDRDRDRVRDRIGEVNIGSISKKLGKKNCE